MGSVIVIGASGHAAEIQDYIRAVNIKSGEQSIDLKGFIDDDPDAYGRYEFDGPYLGSIKEHRVDPELAYIMGIANHSFRRSIVERLLSEGAIFISLIHPSAYISFSATIGSGCLIGPNVNIGPNVSIGNFNLLNSRCSLGHDSKLGNFNIVGPNVSFSGETKVGDDNLFGISSVTKPRIQIGDRNRIEAGMVMDKSIQDDTVVFYRYKEKVIAVPRS